jgi:hypothetical protein
MAERPTHEVTRTFDADGNIVTRTETWDSPTGDHYGEAHDFARGTRETWLHRADSSISWRYNAADNEYCLSWLPVPPEPPIKEPAPPPPDASIPGVRCARVLRNLAWLRSDGPPFEVSDSTGRLKGRDVRIIEITIDAAAADKERGWIAPLTRRFYLTPDGSRLVADAGTIPADSNERGVARVETYPIEYDTTPPSSLFEVNVPKGARVTHGHEPIDRMWEVMSDAEQDAIRKTAEGFLQAWANGDVEAFESHCDFAAGLQYGVKGKLTAEEIRERSRELVAEQKGRFAEQQWTMDYAYETTRPPGMSMAHWHIKRENPQSDGNWILFRQQPIEEPGVAVLARGRVTTHEGDSGKLGMYLFLKEIEGRYKVVLWRPPYGKYGY